jgi:hypothetical protein
VAQVQNFFPFLEEMMPPESFALAADVLAVDRDAHFPDRR